MAKVEQVARTGGGLAVTLAGRIQPLVLTWTWLRDHCRCPECYDGATHQRRVESAAIPPGIEALDAIATATGDAVDVTWPDGHASRYPAAFLAALAAPPAAHARALWDAARLAGTDVAVDHAAFVNTEAGLRRGLRHLALHGLLLVPGTEPTSAATQRVAERIGYVRASVFGAMWGFEADASRADSAYTSVALPLHTDATYSFDAPGLQVLHCVELDATGAESILADGFWAAEALRESHPQHFETLATFPVLGQYVERDVHLSARRPILRLDPAGRVVQVSLNDADRAPFLANPQATDRFYAALRAFRAIVDDPAGHYRFRLEPGTVLIFDNWRVLHARTAYTGHRRVVGCYLNREDFESRLRVAAAKA